MGRLEVEVDPRDVGFDAERLARIDSRFARHVDEGLLAGWLALVARRGKIVHLSAYGMRDSEAGLPVELDTLWRLYSMTKPITSVAAMMLCEEGALELRDPVSRFIPAFYEPRVYRSGSALAPATVPASEPIRIWHLLTHTAGLTYGFLNAHPVDAMYREAGFEGGVPVGADLAECCERWAHLPLLFEPGSEWNYSVATDVLGRVIEVVSGQNLDEFLAERIFQPLNMTDTGYSVPAGEASRLAALYIAHPETKMPVRNDQFGNLAFRVPQTVSGGDGLISTAFDYHRFLLMLLGGGELDGRRLLGPQTVSYMTRNHLPGGADLASFGRSAYSETTFEGVGFGLGFAVVDDPVANKVLSVKGEASWGGAASTTFWLDPTHEITCVFMTQLVPSAINPFRSQLKQLVYQALIE